MVNGVLVDVENLRDCFRVVRRFVTLYQQFPCFIVQHFYHLLCLLYTCCKGVTAFVRSAIIPSPRRKFSFRRPVGFTIRTPAFVRLHTARRSNCPVVSNCACNYGFKTCRPRFCLRPVSGDISLRAVLRSSTVIANAQDSRLSCPNRPIIAGCKSNREQQQAAKHDRHDRKHPFPHLNPPSY